MRKRFKSILYFIFLLFIVCLSLGVGYIFYDKISSDSDIVVDGKITINYLNGKKFNLSGNNEITFSVTNNDSEAKYYYIQLTDVYANDVSYELISSDNLNITNNLKSEIVSNQVSINGNETINYTLKFKVNGNEKYSGTIQIGLKENDKNTFADVILANNKVNEKSLTGIGESAILDEGLLKKEDDHGVAYYFRGNVKNNNVLFGGFCWKIVRTTETGGVKIVYNGVQKDKVQISPLEQSSYVNINNDTTYPYTFDSTSKTWVSTNKTDSKTGTITFTVETAGDYYLSYSVSSEANYDKAKFYKNETVIGDSNGYSGTVSGTIALTGLTTSDVIKVEYTKDSSGASGSDTVTFSIGKAVGDPVKSCNNTGTDSQIGTSAFNNDYNSPAYVGYMHNTVYPVTQKSMSTQSNIVFGNSFTYANGTYTLKDTKTVATWSSGYNTINNNHYTCMTTGTTCTSIYYVYYTSTSTAYYITLTNGKSVNDALFEMLYANDLNKNDSTIKNYIDKWYIDNLKAYENKLEDTVFCNDRRILNLNGWEPNGGDTTNFLYFKNYDTSNKSLVCANETDRFSMSNPKAKLSYPIGLLSMPELSLAGYGGSHYFNNGQDVWLVSPVNFDYFDAYVWVAFSGGLTSYKLYNSRGVRPSVSLKPNTYFSSGDGSFTNPFVIGDAVEEPSGNSFDTVFAANNTDIFNENGLRYEGADPKNYICLDNKTSGACSSSSLLFRIIGLFDEEYSSNGTTSSGTKKLLKVIDTNNFGGTDGKYWNRTQTSGKNYNDWSTATLKTELNDTYLSALLATSGVNSKLESAIITSKWHLGGAGLSNYQTLTAEGIYTEERNTSAISSGNPSSIYAKVGLMYPSDFGYATVGGTTTNKTGCRAKELYNWNSSSYSDCKNNDWIFTSQNSFADNREWLLSPYSMNSTDAAHLYSGGYVHLNGYRVVGGKFAVRPTFYLDSSILKIVGTGDGSSSNPYRVG